MAEEIKFADGIVFKLPREGAPDFVKGSLSLKTEDVIKFLQQNSENGWCNVDLKVSKAGKAYASLNTWKPEPQGQENNKPNYESDDPPF